jgi:DNA-binding LacI/PurR family transcriptional regulator
VSKEVAVASISDVARRANVALSTVSYDINGTRPVSKETYARIRKAMDELGYRPNALARGLATKRSRNLGLIFPAVERGLGITEMEFVTAAAEAASDHGYHLVLWTIEADDTEMLTRLISQGLVDGVIVMEVHLDDPRVNTLRGAGMPFCMIGRTSDPQDESYADIDFAQTTNSAVGHLTELGHTTIAFVNHSRAAFEAGYGPSVRAQEGFLEAARAAGVTATTRFCEDSPAAGARVFDELLVELPGLSALVMMNERASAGVLSAGASRGLIVPRDYSVVSIVSSSRVAEMTYPPLTALSPPTAQLGRVGVEVLIERLDNGSAPLVRELLPCALHVRGSTGPARQTTTP